MAIVGVIPYEFHDGGHLPVYEPFVPVVLLRAIGIILVRGRLRRFGAASQSQCSYVSNQIHLLFLYYCEIHLPLCSHYRPLHVGSNH